jgi:phage terminase large subunit GpA-like protein
MDLSVGRQTNGLVGRQTGIDMYKDRKVIDRIIYVERRRDWLANE